jgi:hypothetical protein
VNVKKLTRVLTRASESGCRASKEDLRYEKLLFGCCSASAVILYDRRKNNHLHKALLVLQIHGVACKKNIQNQKS